MQCPKCKSQNLAKKSYNAPHFCPECEGLWMQQKDFVKNPDLVTDLGTVTESANEQDKHTGVCPEGHGIMLRARVELDEPFYLERCTTCGGIWFDKGEWRRIVDNHLLPGLTDLWSATWQRQRQAAVSRERFLEMNRESFGDEVYTSVIALAQMLKGHPLRQRVIAFLSAEMGEISTDK